MTISLPLHLKTKDNQRGHWSQRAKSSKVERRAAWLSVKAGKMPPFPVRVTITRCGPRKIDVCNLGSALKSIVDGIADAYQVDDGDERWQWILEQREQPAYGVEIEIQSIETVPK